jgi:hypothetical protein
VVWVIFGVAVVLLWGAGDPRAGDPAREGVYWLGTGHWQLCFHAGRVCLVETDWDKAERPRKDQPHKWYISAPTIKDEKGRFLASDPLGSDPTVHLVKEKGDNTRWVFEFVSQIEPKRARGEGPNLKEGPGGFTFRVKLAEGPFKGWYLAAGERSAEPEDRRDEGPPTRPVKLVRDVKAATVFTYIEEFHYVKHY